MKLATYIEMKQRGNGVPPSLKMAFETGRTLLTTTAGHQDGEDPPGELLYDIAAKLANNYLETHFGLCWDDLSDTNSLWDAVECVGKNTTWVEFKKEVMACIIERVQAE